MIEIRGDFVGSYRKGFAGDCFNTAYYFHACAETHWTSQFFTAVGDDKISDEMLSFMQSVGVQTTYVSRIPNKSVGLYMIETDKGERSFQYWRSMSAARYMLSGQTLSVPVEAADIIFVSGITLAILPEQQRAELLDTLFRARAGGKIVAFDPNLRPRLWETSTAMRYWIMKFGAASSIVLPSFSDEAEAFGDSSSRQTIERYRTAGAQHITVKNGDQPVLFDDGQSIGSVEVSPAIQVVDSTSAGDAFNGAYLAQIANGAETRGAITFAAAISCQVIAQHGAITPINTKVVDKRANLT